MLRLSISNFFCFQHLENLPREEHKTALKDPTVSALRLYSMSGFSFLACTDATMSGNVIEGLIFCGLQTGLLLSCSQDSGLLIKSM